MPIVGDIKALIQLNNGNILAGTNQATIYRSTDDGLTWTLTNTLGTGIINAFVKTTDGVVFAALTGIAATQGIWRNDDKQGIGWLKVKSHPKGGGFGYLDITTMQGSKLAAVGYGTLSTTDGPILVSNDGGASWLQAVQPHFTHNFISIAGYPEPVLNTAYPNEPNNIIPAFYGSDTYFTQTGKAGMISGTAAAAFNLPYLQMGNGGLDMVSFLVKPLTYNVRALWAVKSWLNIADTEIWQYPSSPTGPYQFAKIATITSNLFNVMYVEPASHYNNIGTQRTIWAGSNGKIYVSYNSGLTWAVSTEAPTQQVYAFVRTASGVMIAGGANGEIFRFQGTGSEGGGGDPPVDEDEEEDEEEEETPEEPPEDPEEPVPPITPSLVTTRVLGRDATTDNYVMVSNKFSFSNITHSFYYDGSAFINLQYGNEPPYVFLGVVPAVNKAVYFGSKTNDTSVPGGTFAGLVFNIIQAAQGLTIVWEYWNGSAWTALTVQDNTEQFQSLGYKSVTWQVPTNWATTTISTVVGYWVRARVSAIAATIVAPIQGSSYVYTPNLPYVEVASVQVGGDLPATARVTWSNRADDLAAVMDLAIDRLVCGLKSVDRGKNFNAYINVSDTQPLFGISIAKHASATWISNIKAPTNRALSVSFSNLLDTNVWKNLAEISISTTVARDYYGHYRVFLRGHKTGATASDWQVRLATVFGSGGSATNSHAVFPTAQKDWEIFDLGQISIPTTQVSQQAGNLGDILTLIVQGKVTQTGSTLVVYDLILIPSDEWATDVRPPQSSALASAEVKGSYFLDIDSISNPKSVLTALNRNSASQIISRYQAINNGPAILQMGRQQRLWFLAMSYEGHWRAYPEIAGAVQVFKQQRYLGLRGNS